MKAILGMIILALVVLAGGCRPEPTGTADTAESGEPTDLAACLEEIRATGMSESARSSLDMVAGHLTGQMEISFTKDDSSGTYWPGFRSNTCAVSGLHPDVQAETDRRNSVHRQEMVKILRPLADADSSGFVSTREGGDFRHMYEFGLKAAHILTQEGEDHSRACAGCRVSPAQMDSLVASFNEFAAKASLAGIPGLSPVQFKGPKTGAVGCTPTCPGRLGGKGL